MSVWTVGVPEILIAGELDYINVAGKAHLATYLGKIELQSESCCTPAVLVDCQKRPLIIRTMNRIHSDGGQ